MPYWHSYYYYYVAHSGITFAMDNDDVIDVTDVASDPGRECKNAN